MDAPSILLAVAVIGSGILAIGLAWLRHYGKRFCAVPVRRHDWHCPDCNWSNPSTVRVCVGCGRPEGGAQ